MTGRVRTGEARPPPLARLRVIELGRGVAAAYCARQFAAWGADVVTLEPPGGSPVRRLHPFAVRVDGTSVSLVWVNVAAGKQAVDLGELTSEALNLLLARADVVVTDLSATVLAKSGVDLDELRRRSQRLCIVSVSPFGLDGPYADFTGSELIVQALSGYLGLNGLMNQPPLRAPGRLIDYAIGVNAFVGALAALIKFRRTGWGEMIEVSGIETLAAMVPFLRVQYMGTEKLREGGTEAGVRILPCADGYVSFLTVDRLQKAVLGELLRIQETEWPDDLYEGGYHEVVTKTVAFFSTYTRRMTADEVFYALEHRGITCGRVLTPSDLLASEQLKARGWFRRDGHPALGELAYPGPPALTRTSRPAEPSPAPTASVDPAALAWNDQPSVALTGRAGELPLAGLRVLDLTQAWIGPFAALIMADLGAEVIKIESHRRPDVWRQASPQPTAITNIKAERVNRSHYFNSVNRNKRSLTLDLRSTEGRALFLELVANADVVAENYTPRVMDRFGLGYAELSRVKPDLVMMSSSGFGKTGPWTDFKTNGSAIEALAGWDALHRYPGGPPLLMGFYQADAICGLQMAALTLIGLINRDATGQGEAIDGAMLDASAGYLGEILLQEQLAPGSVEALGNRSLDMAPHGVFQARGDDRWIALAVADDESWRALLTVPGRPDVLADTRFADLAGRLAHQDSLDAEIETWTREQDADALMNALQSAGVAAGVVRTAREGLTEPHLAARDWFKTMTHPDLGAHKYNGFLWRFAGCELKAELPPPRLGEHSDQLLRELLGLDDDKIAELKAKDVTGAVL